MSVSAVNKSVDESGVSVAAPRERTGSDHAWVAHVTILSIALGIMLALAIRTTTRIRSAGLPANRLGVSAAWISVVRSENERQQQTIKELNERIRSFENNITDQTKSVELLKQSFTEMRAWAGFSGVQGPGLKLVLQDSPEARLPNLRPDEVQGYMVHDSDINGVLNELKAAGAEALAIGGVDGKNFQRVVATTSARCVGPTALVNGVSLSAPYTIIAIGSPRNLRAALEMPNGFVESRSLNILKMITFEESDNLVLPQYAGNPSFKHARPAPPNP